MRRVELYWIVAGLLIVSLPLILLLSDRHWVLSDQHRAAAHIADIPPGSADLLPTLQRLTAYAGVHVIREQPKAETLYEILVATGRLPASRVPAIQEPPRYGVSIREWTFLGMPFGWYEEFGPVVYYRNRWELVMAPLGNSGEALLANEVGRDLKQGFVFPFWAHAWGWLYVALLALWGWLHFRRVAAWREATGTI